MIDKEIRFRADKRCLLVIIGRLFKSFPFFMEGQLIKKEKWLLTVKQSPCTKNREKEKCCY